MLPENNIKYKLILRGMPFREVQIHSSSSRVIELDSFEIDPPRSGYLFFEWIMMIKPERDYYQEPEMELEKMKKIDRVDH